MQKNKEFRKFCSVLAIKEFCLFNEILKNWHNLPSPNYLIIYQILTLYLYHYYYKSLCFRILKSGKI